MQVNDQAAAYAATWEHFASASQLAWHRDDFRAWSAGYSTHALLLLRLEPAVARAVGQVQEVLQGLDGVELHPPEFLHISVQSLGFLVAGACSPSHGELHTGELEGVIDALASALSRSPAFSITIGAPNSFASAAFLEVDSQGALSRLRTTLRGALGVPPETFLVHPVTAELRSTHPTLTARIDPYESGFIFHLSVAYYGRGARVLPVRTALAQGRRMARPIRMSVREVDLVRVATAQRVAFPPLETLARFQLR
jgi:hypothetical protein